MLDPVLHQVFSVRATETPEVYILDVDLTDVYGERYRCDYVSAPDDPYGLAPTIRQWLSDHRGEYEVQPYTEPVPPTDEERRASMPNVSARQLRLTLVRNGFPLSSIDQAIATLPAGQQKDEALIEWEYAHEFQRVSPTLNTIAAALGINQTNIDAMWAQALAS